MITIRAYRDADWPALWGVLEPVFRAGDTYSFDAGISEPAAHHAWVQIPLATFVAESDAERILGTYFIKPNQPGQGAHVCNCGYAVAATARGRGIASLMCEHSQAVASTQGFRAMQYNLVVSTNEVAVRLWKRHGFEIVGTLPDAFRHPRHGYVDAYVMYKRLKT